MKRFCRLFLCGLIALIVAAPLSAAPAKVESDKSPSAAVAGAISTITGIAISPLLGTGARGGA